MRNIKVMMSYRGTNYHGFQRQENAVAIQNILEDKLSVITNSPVVINGCSRTDTGVHANEYCFSFLTEHSIPCNNIVRAMNSILPDDISIQSCEDVSMDFHARYSCKGKEYVYDILNRPTKDPFKADLALHYPYELNLEMLQIACRDFVGTHDFEAFCGTNNKKENCVRTIYSCNIEKADADGMIIFTVSGNGFLYNMVRIMVGTLIFMNEGKIPCNSISDIILSKDRNKAGKTANAHGLYLNKVFY